MPTPSHRGAPKRIVLVPVNENTHTGAPLFAPPALDDPLGMSLV